MMPRWFARRVVSPGLLIGGLLVIAGCSNPIGSDEATGTPYAQAAPAGTPVATVTRAAALPIVTATPIPAGATVPAPEPPRTGEDSENPDTYVVEEGDTLYAIALRFGVEIRAIIEANGLSNPNDIFAGQELKIPPPE